MLDIASAEYCGTVVYCRILLRIFYIGGEGSGGFNIGAKGLFWTKAYVGHTKLDSQKPYKDVRPVQRGL